MSGDIDSKALLSNIEKVFVEQNKYLFDKHVPEFVVDGKFLGDYFSQIAVELKGNQPPRFYHNLSPFDVISKKSPDRALVFEAGELLVDMDFTKYARVRTAIMTGLVLRSIGVTSLANKKVLLIGSGNIAQQAVRLLKGAYPELSEVWCISKSGDITAITVKGQEVGVKVSTGNLDELKEFDVIICHTSTNEALLRDEHLARLKKGVFIASFISSTENGELEDSYYDTDKANIICDWDATKSAAKDLARAINTSKVDESEIVLLDELFSGKKNIDLSKTMTIYRSVGTPIQNLAVLQLLV